MQITQNYILTINDLFTLSGGVICGAEAEVAIMDGGIEVDRVKLSGKVGPDGEGYRRSYAGKPGLTAELVSGPGKIHFDSVSCG